MEFFLIWFFFSVIVGIMASKRQRSGFLYFLLCLVLSPLLIGILVLVLGNAKARPIPVTVVSPVPNPGEGDEQTRCPECRELVRIDARKCKHCGTALIAAAPAAPLIADKSPAALPRNW